MRSLFQRLPHQQHRLLRTLAAGGDHRHGARYIRTRRKSLVSQLMEDAHAVDRWDAPSLQKVFDLISSLVHLKYNALGYELSEKYERFCPERTSGYVKNVKRGSTPQGDDTAAVAFLRQFDELADKANFDQIDQELLHAMLTKRTSASSAQDGIDVIVDVSRFDILKIWTRGEVMWDDEDRRYQKYIKTEPSMRGPLQRMLAFRQKESDPKDILYQRLMVLCRQRPPEDENSSSPLIEDRKLTVLLKVFKEVPASKLDLILPFSRIRMPLKDKLLIMGAGIASSITIALKYILMTSDHFDFSVIHSASLLASSAVLFGAGFQIYNSYQRKRHQYEREMLAQVYYLNMSNDNVVCKYVVNESESQEIKEAILGLYFIMKAGRDGIEGPTLKREIEQFLNSSFCEADVDFDLLDAIAKLKDMNLIEQTSEGQYRSFSEDQLLIRLRETWQRFHFGEHR